MLKSHTLKLFSTSDQTDFPIYTITDGKLYRTIKHPLGWSEHADYELGKDGKLYRTVHHPSGTGSGPDYEFRGSGKLFRTSTHPDGPTDLPEYEIQD
ncbi:MAG: hypothetical protein GY850_11500 [bacterium]|nr:hypothetical protein [bacterium]